MGVWNQSWSHDHQKAAIDIPANSPLEKERTEEDNAFFAGIDTELGLIHYHRKTPEEKASILGILAFW